MNLSGHQSPRMGTDTWLTPPEWIKALGPFDLDPACPPDMPWPTAGTMLTQAQDGLTAPWYGRVWLNPPFGQQAAKWLAKMVRHGDGIALIPARTETVMFYESVWEHADSICFVKGRPHFHRGDGTRAPFNSGAPIALVAYGVQNTFRLIEANLGMVLLIDQKIRPVDRKGVAP
jgi:hypothetical protein